MSVVLGMIQPKLNAKSRSMHSLAYRPDIDGLRAVAVLAVVCFHATSEILPGGFAGVDVFFVISGFLISSIVFRGLLRDNFSFLRFYIRRAKRIFPALIVMLTAVTGLCWLVLLPDEYQDYGLHLAAGAGFFLNLELYQELAQYFDKESPLLHLWSLGVEEQFYLFWPVFVVVTWRYLRSPLLLMLVAAIISFCLNLSAVAAHSVGAFYLPTCRLWELAMGGMLAYVQLQRGDNENVRGLRASVWPLSVLRKFKLSPNARSTFGAILILASFISLKSQDAFPGWLALAPTVGEQEHLN